MTPTSLRSLLRENAWQLILYLLGTVLVWRLSWLLAVIYLAYSLLSNVWYMAYVCPYCAHYGLGTCRAGFHLLSGGRFKPRPGHSFAAQFRRNVAVMIPGWFVPPFVAIYLLLRAFSWPLLVMLIAFCLIGFVILPKDAQRHCQECEMVDCPRRPRR